MYSRNTLRILASPERWAQMPDKPLPLLSKTALPLVGFVLKPPQWGPSPDCSLPFANSALTTSVSLDVPKVFSSCCLEGWPR